MNEGEEFSHLSDGELKVLELCCLYLLSVDEQFTQAEQDWIDAKFGPQTSERFIQTLSTIDWTSCFSEIKSILGSLPKTEQDYILNYGPVFFEELLSSDGITAEEKHRLEGLVEFLKDPTSSKPENKLDSSGVAAGEISPDVSKPKVTLPQPKTSSSSLRQPKPRGKPVRKNKSSSSSTHKNESPVVKEGALHKICFYTKAFVARFVILDFKYEAMEQGGQTWRTLLYFLVKISPLSLLYFIHPFETFVAWLYMLAVPVVLWGVYVFILFAIAMGGGGIPVGRINNIKILVHSPTYIGGGWSKSEGGWIKFFKHVLSLDWSLDTLECLISLIIESLFYRNIVIWVLAGLMFNYSFLPFNSDLDNAIRRYIGNPHYQIGFYPKKFYPKSTTLADLQELDLSKNDLISLNSRVFPDTFSSLESLTLSDNRLSKINPVAKLDGLKLLDISTNAVAIIEPLESLANLVALKTGNNKISNLDPLGKLSNLEYIDLSNNEVADLKTLYNLKKLRYLNISGNKRISRKQVDDFIDHNPTCEVESDYEMPWLNSKQQVQLLRTASHSPIYQYARSYPLGHTLISKNGVIISGGWNKELHDYYLKYEGSHGKRIGVGIWELSSGKHFKPIVDYSFKTDARVIGPGNSVIGVGTYDTGLSMFTRRFVRSFGEYLRSSDSGDYGAGLISVGPDATVYRGSDEGLIAFSGFSGEIRWVSKIGAPGYNPVVGKNGIVYFSSQNGIHALNSENGAKIWKIRTQPIPSTIVIGFNEMIYVTQGPLIYALNGRTGARIWQYTMAGNRVYQPVIDGDGTVLIGSVNKKLYALNGYTGKKKWETEIEEGIKACPIVGDNGIIYIASFEHRGASHYIYKICSIEAKTGSQKEGLYPETPIVPGKREVYNKVKRYSVTKAVGISGSERTYSIEIEALGQLVSRGDIISDERTVDSVSGKRKLSELEIGQPVIGPDGTIYVETRHGLTAFKTTCTGPAKSSWPQFQRNGQRTACVSDEERIPLGRLKKWTVGKDNASIDLAYLGQPVSVVLQAFGRPDTSKVLSSFAITFKTFEPTGNRQTSKYFNITVNALDQNEAVKIARSRIPKKYFMPLSWPIAKVNKTALPNKDHKFYDSELGYNGILGIRSGNYTDQTVIFSISSGRVNRVYFNDTQK